METNTASICLVDRIREKVIKVYQHCQKKNQVHFIPLIFKEYVRNGRWEYQV